MTEKTPLTREQYSRLEDSITEMQHLHDKQNETLEELKKCYALAYLAGVHPDELKGRVSHKIVYDPTVQTTLFRWRKAKLKIKVRPTADPDANMAASRLGIIPELEFPMKDVPHCLWDPTDLKSYRSFLKRNEAKENTNGNQ